MKFNLWKLGKEQREIEDELKKAEKLERKNQKAAAKALKDKAQRRKEELS